MKFLASGKPAAAHFEHVCAADAAVSAVLQVSGFPSGAGWLLYLVDDAAPDGFKRCVPADAPPLPTWLSQRHVVQDAQ